MSTTAPATHDAGQSPPDAEANCELLLTLARALHEVGEPSHRVEETLYRAAELLGSKAHVLALPTALVVSFERPGGPQTHVLRPRPGRVNLERLSDITTVANNLVSGKITPAAATDRIEAITTAPLRWKWPATIAAYVLSAGAFAVFFRGGLPEVAAATIVGLAVGSIAVLFQWRKNNTRIFELTAAAAAAAITGVVDHMYVALVDWVPLAAGLIVLLPGIGLVDSVEELASGHLVAGAARLAGVGVVFLALTFGTVLGMAVADAYVVFQTGQHQVLVHEIEKPVPLPYATLPALVIVAIGSMMRFRSNPRDLVLIFCASTLALLASRTGTQYVGPLAGSFLASFALGLAGNVYARVKHKAGEQLTIPGIALLVPGSIGVQSIGALLSRDTAAGIDAAFQMFVVAMALAAGFLFSNAIVREPPPG